MSAFIAITDPIGAQLSDGTPQPHRTWIEIFGPRVYGIEPLERKLGPIGAQALVAAIRAQPHAGSFDRFTWEIGARQAATAQREAA